MVLGAGESDVEEAVLVGLFGGESVAEQLKNRSVGMGSEDLRAVEL